jgi:hypothetical protein
MSRTIPFGGFVVVLALVGTACGGASDAGSDAAVCDTPPIPQYCTGGGLEPPRYDPENRPEYKPEYRPGGRGRRG